MACNSKTRSRGRVTFSWENKPGVCREAAAQTHHRCDDENLLKKQLRPPPCTYARKDNRKTQKDGGVEDPFLAAYKECTKSKKNKSGFGGWSSMKLFGSLSCKRLTAVRDDSLTGSPVSRRTA